MPTLHVECWGLWPYHLRACYAVACHAPPPPCFHRPWTGVPARLSDSGKQILRLHVRLVSVLNDTDEAASVFGRKKGSSPFCHFLDADGNMDPDYFVPLQPAQPPPPPPPDAPGVPDGAGAAAAGAPPPEAGKKGLRAVKRPASTPCMLTPNNLRAAFGKDKVALKQAKFLSYPDVPVRVLFVVVSRVPSDMALGAPSLFWFVVPLHPSSHPLGLQCATESCAYRRATGTGHCLGQGDLMHVVRAGGGAG